MFLGTVCYLRGNWAMGKCKGGSCFQTHIQEKRQLTGGAAVIF